MRREVDAVRIHDVLLNYASLSARHEPMSEFSWASVLAALSLDPLRQGKSGHGGRIALPDDLKASQPVLAHR
ncbi:MAG: hypothetical protein ACLSA6_12840 [Holdemania massiliensis]